MMFHLLSAPFDQVLRGALSGVLRRGDQQQRRIRLWEARAIADLLETIWRDLPARQAALRLPWLPAYQRLLERRCG